jgi:hypothetical protein
MNAMRQLLNAIRLSAAGMIVLATTTTFAEVAVLDAPQQSQLRRPIILGIITDEPDPTALVWEPTTSSPSHIVLNPEGAANGDGKPSLVRNHVTHVTAVVWSKNSPTGYDVVISRFEDDSWTAPEPLAATPADELDPYLAIDPADGTFHLVYWIDDTPPRVMHRQAPADLSSWSAPVQVSQVGESACNPSAVTHDGLLRVVYEAHDLGVGLTPRQIVMATATGGGFVHEACATTWHSGRNAPEVHSAGGVLWVDWLDATDEIGWTRQHPQTGAWETVRTEIFTTIEERDYLVRGGIRFKAWD